MAAQGYTVVATVSLSPSLPPSLNTPFYLCPSPVRTQMCTCTHARTLTRAHARSHTHVRTPAHARTRTIRKSTPSRTTPIIPHFTHCNTLQQLQHIATHCNTLQHTANCTISIIPHSHATSVSFGLDPFFRRIAQGKTVFSSFFRFLSVSVFLHLTLSLSLYLSLDALSRSLSRSLSRAFSLLSLFRSRLARVVARIGCCCTHWLSPSLLCARFLSHCTPLMYSDMCVGAGVGVGMGGWVWVWVGGCWMYSCIGGQGRNSNERTSSSR